MNNSTENNNSTNMGDTANTVQSIDCVNSSNLEQSSEQKLPIAICRLIDVLARQAAREICGNEGV